MGQEPGINQNDGGREDIREHVRALQDPADGTARQDSDDLTTSDGAIRQLEKADLVNQGTGRSDIQSVPDQDFGEVIPLGNDTGGASEDAVADTNER